MKEESKKRGPYQNTKRKAEERPTNYFVKEHEHQGHYITWAGVVDRGNGSISVAYKVLGVSKQFRCPRWKTVWFDKYGLDFAKNAVEEWKKSCNNSTGKGDFIPQFYLKHRKDFIKWLSASASHSTIQGYEIALRQYVFPYLVVKLQLNEPIKWTNDSISNWDASLMSTVMEIGSRNRKRTAFRRYLKFLKRMNIIKVVPQIFDESQSRNTTETPIPGDLPDWTNALTWLRTLPAGKYRFTRAITMAFGLRISEAVSVTEDDFIGEESKDELSARNDFISRLIEKKLGYLFLNVNKAEKKRVNIDIIKFLGKEQSNEPKSGPYIACCTSLDMANFILELIENNEHLGEFSRDDVYRIKKSITSDQSGFKFDKYNPHDDRRLNITLQCLDLGMNVNDVVEICCTLHGQSSRDVFSRYFQWGQTQRRKQKRQLGTKLKIFE